LKSQLFLGTTVLLSFAQQGFRKKAIKVLNPMISFAINSTLAEDLQGPNPRLKKSKKTTTNDTKNKCYRANS
jgi:hypothetical protein